MMEQIERTRRLLCAHVQRYPASEIQDVFKFLHQSAFGCEHLVTSPEKVTDRILREFEELSQIGGERIEPLDGAYSRVHLVCLCDGLRAETLGRLFCASAKREPKGLFALESKLAVAKALTKEGLLPFSSRAFEEAVRAWKADGYPAVRHSDSFRASYRPAYRVIASEYVPYLSVFAEIDRALQSADLSAVAADGCLCENQHFRETLRYLYGGKISISEGKFIRED